jgi:alpha-ribazole phosphatase
MKADNETQLDLLRHGEPLGGQRYRGQLDDVLSERGWEQMWQSVGEHTGWQQIVSSPLQRCHAFAAALAERTGVPVRSEPRFAEVGFGQWEGKTRAELEQLDPGQLSRFYQDPVNNRPSGAEPLQQFLERVHSGFMTLLSDYPGQTVLVVAHAGVIRAILSHVLEMPPAAMYRIYIANAGMTRLRSDRERGYTLVSHGAAGPSR